MKEEDSDEDIITKENVIKNANLDVNIPAKVTDDDKFDERSSNRSIKKLPKVVSEIQEEDIETEESELERELDESNPLIV